MKEGFLKEFQGECWDESVRETQFTSANARLQTLRTEAALLDENDKDFTLADDILKRHGRGQAAFQGTPHFHASEKMTLANIVALEPALRHFIDILTRYVSSTVSVRLQLLHMRTMFLMEVQRSGRLEVAFEVMIDYGADDNLDTTVLAAAFCGDDMVTLDTWLRQLLSIAICYLVQRIVDVKTQRLLLSIDILKTLDAMQESFGCVEVVSDLTAFRTLLEVGSDEVTATQVRRAKTCCSTRRAAL